uniref:Uncharacterized protein n=1 Tax=Variovorax sp. HH01 TaxID=1084736 RepID=I3PCR9_9BURK|nr:hypothetical protein var099 [Variovorax sp. HH01]
MLPKTPIAWRRRTTPASSNLLIAYRTALVADARTHAIEAYLWGARDKAPPAYQNWLDERIAHIDSVLALTAVKGGT